MAREARMGIPGMPSLKEVCEDKVPTKKFVPKGARREWAMVLIYALQNVVKFNDKRAWADMLGEPK